MELKLNASGDDIRCIYLISLNSAILHLSWHLILFDCHRFDFKPIRDHVTRHSAVFLSSNKNFNNGDNFAMKKN